VERCFQQGLLKVVFATETLAAGINMPARTTVISTLSRRRDNGHSALLHNELLQMAGRAGRRGFDTAGTATLALNLLVSQSFDQPVNQPINMFGLVSQSISQPISQPTKQASKQASQSINQPINQSNSLNSVSHERSQQTLKVSKRHEEHCMLKAKFGTSPTRVPGRHVYEALYYVTMSHYILCYITLHYITLHYITLHYMVLYYTVLNYTILYFVCDTFM